MTIILIQRELAWLLEVFLDSLTKTKTVTIASHIFSVKEETQTFKPTKLLSK